METKEVYAGFDASSYPGDNIMKSLWDHTNLYWCGFYLGPHYNFTPHYGTLAGIGWGIAPIFMGVQSNPPTGPLSTSQKQQRYAEGARDGRTAVGYAAKAGIRPPKTLYFDAERKHHDAGWVEHFAGWSRAVVDAGHGVGCYCYADFAPWLTSAIMNRPGFDTVLPTIWAVNIKDANPVASVKRDPKGNMLPWAWLPPEYPELHPRKSGYSAATSWQRAHGYGFEWQDGTLAGKPVKRRLFPVDLDTSVYRDPGNPALKFLED